MSYTQQTGNQLRNGAVTRDLLDVSTPGQSVVRRLSAGPGITLNSTGVDSGTGDVTVNAGSAGDSIGSMIETRNAPGPNYLACDRSPKLKSQYPELSSLITSPPVLEITQGSWTGLQQGAGAIAFSGSLYVAIRSGEGYVTSVDTVNWSTIKTFPSSLACSWIYYSSGMFFAGATGSTSYCTSTDGNTWTLRTFPASIASPRPEIVHNGSTYLWVMNGLNSYTSTDGISWTARAMPSNTSWGHVAWNGSVFCVTCTALTATAATSPDGINWTTRNLGLSFITSDIIWDGTKFMVVGAANGTTPTASYVTSLDGATWTIRSFPIVSNYLRTISSGASGVLLCFGDTKFGTPVVLVSRDYGATWEQRSFGGFHNLAYGIWDGSQFVLIGTQITGGGGYNETLPDIGFAKDDMTRFYLPDIPSRAAFYKTYICAK